MNIIQDYISMGRGNRPAKLNPCLYITIHNTGNTAKGSNAKNHASYLKGDTAAKAPVSWHYTVDDNEVYQHLPDNETAFHAGDGANGTGNAKSIGIEICMNSDGDLLKATDNAAQLTAILCARHSISLDNVVQHNHWTGKNCPQLIRANKPYGWDVFKNTIRRFMDVPEVSQTPILNTPEASVYQAKIWAKKVGADEIFIDLAPKYWDYCGSRGGVDPLLAYCQSALETGYGKFNGVVDKSYCNPCGLKTATGGSDTDKEAHQRFISWEEGVKAHLDHLALYADAAGYPRFDSPDPRHFPYLLGAGKTLETMAKAWAPSSVGYAATVLRLMNEVKDVTPELPENNIKTPEEITVDNAIADGVLIDRAHWLGVLNGIIVGKPEYIKTVLDRYHERLL